MTHVARCGMVDDGKCADSVIAINRRNEMFPKAIRTGQRYFSRPSSNVKHVMTTFVAAPTPITSSQHPSTPPSQSNATQPRPISPTTVSNEPRSTQSAQTANNRAYTVASDTPNPFIARMDELAHLILEGPQVTWAIEQGMSATEIASWCGIRQGSDAYQTLEFRVEARRFGAVGDGLGL